MEKLIVLAFILAVVCGHATAQNNNASTWSFITPCHQGDHACHRASAQKALPLIAAGIPELGINSLDPANIEKVIADSLGLKVRFDNSLVKGLKGCLVMELRRAGRKNYLELKCPAVSLVGDYVMSGKLLILPIEGQGKYKIRIRDLIVKINYELSEKEVGGERYWVVATWKHSTDVLTNVNFYFQNLFHGNKQLSDSIHQFANANWRDIYHEVAPPIVHAIVARIVDEVTRLFDAVPHKYLALD